MPSLGCRVFPFFRPFDSGIRPDSPASPAAIPSRSLLGNTFKPLAKAGGSFRSEGPKWHNAQSRAF
jgi:hypothetical protein